MLNKYMNLALITIIKLFSMMGFRVLYILSDFLFFWVYRVFGYRRSVVRSNLMRSFPEKTSGELKKIEKHYFRHLCDVMLESLKTGGMDAEEMQKRMLIRNPEMVNRYLDKGTSVVIMAMHYANWEWLLHMPLAIRHRQFFVYKPLHNEMLDDYLNGLRGRFGGETVPMSIALRKVIEADKSGEPVMTWLAADQAPPWFNSFWTIFLNQETQFFEGPARIAQRFNQPILFQLIRKNKRGYYETWFELLTEEPQKMSEEEIILAYVARTEQFIQDTPAYYIWSHKRWKHLRPSDVPLRTRDRQDAS